MPIIYVCASYIVRGKTIYNIKPEENVQNVLLFNSISFIRHAVAGNQKCMRHVSAIIKYK